MAQHELSNKEIIVRLLKSDLSDYDNLLSLLGMANEVIREDKELSRKLANKVRFLALRLCATGDIKYYDLYNKALLFLAQEHKDFDSYLLYVEKNRDPEDRYYQPRRNKIYWLVQKMQRLIDDELDILSISMPPGTGKTTLGEFFISFVMGHYPNTPNLMSSHSGFMTRMFYDAVLNIITSNEYCWSDVFPDIVFEGNNAKEETINLGRWQPFKTLTCRPIRGSLTGVTRCEGFLYVDDLVSGIEEALSIDRLDKLYGEYTTDLKSRKKKKAKEIHIATRWSVHDVIGRLERMYEGNPRAEFIAVPDIDPQTGKATLITIMMLDSMRNTSTIWKCRWMMFHIAACIRAIRLRERVFCIIQQNYRDISEDCRTENRILYWQSAIPKTPVQTTTSSEFSISTETDTIWKIWYSRTSTLEPWTNSTQICLLSIMYSRHSLRATKRVAEPQMRLKDLSRPRAADAILRRNTLLRTKRPRLSSIPHGLRNTSYSRILQNMSLRVITV